MVLLRVELPPQDHFLFGPDGVPLEELLCVDLILSEAVHGRVVKEDCVDTPKKVIEHICPFLGAVLTG